MTNQPGTDRKSTNELPPVLDADGREWGPVRVLPNERTCISCGETVLANETGCTRCEDLQYKKRPTVSDQLVPTISYLRPGEYQLIGAERHA